MNTKSRFPIALLLLGALLLACAGSAFAQRNIIVEGSGVTVTISSLNFPIPLNSSDTILVRSGATLLVDDTATIALLTIGDSSTTGEVVFTGAAVQTLTVAGDVTFGPNSGNSLDMTLSTAHTLKVGGNFLVSGAGTFRAGAATIEYNKATAQSITANVGGIGAVIQYKNLVVSGSPPTGNAPKNFANGVTVQGTLTISQKAVPVGGSVNYGTLAALVYNGSIAQTTTPTEWPAAPTVLNIPVTINNLSGVTLDSDKTIAAIAPNSLTILSGTVNDNGKTLTVRGNILNGFSIATGFQGTGTLVLGGTGPQVLSGIGNYGNLVLNNNATSSLPNTTWFASITQPTIKGRLTIQPGSKVAAPTGTSHQTSFLTYGGADKAPGTYGAVGSGAGTTDNTVFDASATGILTVNAKPVAVVSQSFTPSTITYGTPSLTVSGNATPPVGLADFGNGAQSGDGISNVVVNSSSVAVQTNLTTVVDSSGAYSLSLNTVGLPVGNYTVVTTYRGGANISAASSTASNLTVNPRTIGVVPNNTAKIYGDADPALTYSITNSLVGSDAFTGGLSRVPGENVGAYPITQGTLGLSANYTINFDTTKTLTITKKTINVTVIAASKVYGDPDPPFNRSNIDFTISPQLVSPDSFSGALTRAPGTNAGAYAISVTGLIAGGNGGANYNLVQANSANLTITPLNVTVTFDNQAKTYGSADPLFTYTFTPPLVPQDVFTTNAVTTRDAGQLVSGSPYTIRPGTLNVAVKSNNYSLTFTTTGKLTINPKAVTVTALSQNKAYGAAVQHLSLVSYAGLITSAQNGVSGQTTPATLATLNPATPVSQCSTQGPYPFTITDPGADPNYTLTLGSPASGTMTVTPGPLTVAADNKVKIADGTPFTNGAPFTATDTGYSQPCGDNRGNATVGTLTFGDVNTLTATNPGVYPIIPSGLTSAKYAITFVTGYLAITTLPATTTNTTDETWAGPSQTGVPGVVTSLAWMGNRANGTAGANPGWSLRRINGTLNISATSSDKFRLDLVTLAGNAAGLMAKFDPTRPFSWEIARANAIAGFDPAKFQINAALFANKVFNGVFSVSQTGNSLFLNFTPMGSTGGGVVAIPSGFPVGINFTDTNFLLGNIYNSDVDMLWLSPSSTNITPQQTVTISLNVANLKQAIVGSDVFINFDSRFFKANLTGPGAPQIVAGGGVWDTVIFSLYNVGGDFDTVLAVNLNNAAGTIADGTMARITLTPTATATGKSRVVFRADGGLKADGTGTITNDLVPVVIGAAAVLPARVMTDEITIITDATGPVLDPNTMTATQVQPHVGSINVKNGTAATRNQVVRTSSGISSTTTSGQVVITIPASDAGVGLSGPPTLVLTNGVSSVTLLGTLTSGTLLNGTFTYNWTVSGTTVTGTWVARVTATDTILPTPNTRSISNAFTLSVNTTELTGVVEVESFGGTNRTVTFKTGAGPTNQWDLTNLVFTSGVLLNAGAFQDRAAFVAKVITPPETVSAYLRYGDVVDLPTLAARLANQQGGVSTYIYGLLYGSITSLPTLANTLANPQRAIDSYVISRLSPGTIVALALYQSSQSPANTAALTRGLLNDFNNIVLGANIYDPVRFAGVCANHPTSGPDTVAVNRGLLEDAYVLTCAPYARNYTAGQLRAQTAQRLSQYVGGADPTLLAAILRDFDTFTLSPAMWPVPTHPLDQGIYNQTVFLGVTLSPTTASMLQTPQVGDNLTLLNQLLLQDAYPVGQGQYQRAPLTPATVTAAAAFNASIPATVTAFESAVVTDLNALITGGVSIYTPARFAPFLAAIDPAGELGQLLQLPNPTPAQLIRENRLLLELAYDAELSKSVLSTYRLVQVPTGVTQVSAKTAWNLRVRQAVTFTGGSATANFVNDGVTGDFSATDLYLRGGDITGDNVVNLADYNVLRINFGGTAGGPADINGDGRVNIIDYNLLKVNFGKTGDTEP